MYIYYYSLVVMESTGGAPATWKRNNPLAGPLIGPLGGPL